MSHIYKLRSHQHRRKRTRREHEARSAYGRPLPVQPRRPLKRLPPGHPLCGKVPVITGAALRADPELSYAYLIWSLEQINRWMADGSVDLLDMGKSWSAWRRN